MLIYFFSTTDINFDVTNDYGHTPWVTRKRAYGSNQHPFLNQLGEEYLYATILAYKPHNLEPIYVAIKIPP